MRVLHIDTELTWRGGENQLRLLLEGLRTTEVESFVAVRPGSAAAAKLGRLAPCLELPMRGGFDPIAAWKLAAHCGTHRIQLIDAHTSNAHSLALLTKLFRPELRIVVHRRVDNPPGTSLANRFKYDSPKVDRYVAISEAIKGVLVAYGLSAERIAVARSAVSDEVYVKLDHASTKAALAQTYGIDPNLTFIGNASALSDQKGHDVLLRALRRLLDRGERFHCFIAGDGALRDALEKQRQELKLDMDLSFLGFIEEVPRFLSGLDVLAVPSNNEGLGTVILDGILAGLCVVATSVGGIPEIIRHGETGLLSPVGDDAALADNLARVLASTELRQALNTRAKVLVQKDFSLSAMVNGNLKVYRELLGAK